MITSVDPYLEREYPVAHRVLLEQGEWVSLAAPHRPRVVRVAHDIRSRTGLAEFGTVPQPGVSVVRHRREVLEHVANLPPVPVWTPSASVTIRP